MAFPMSIKRYLLAQIDEDGSINDQLGWFTTKSAALTKAAELLTDYEMITNIAVLEYTYNSTIVTLIAPD